MSKVPLVAIVDDDASVRATTDSLVRSLGYIVYTLASAEEFLRSNRVNDLSCVIADVQMPGMSSVELQAYLLTQGYRVPFIFFTAFPDERIRAQALRSGAICYLTKPFDRGRAVGGTAEKSRDPLDGTDVLALRIGHEPAHAHVFEHALAQRADGLLAHWGLLS